MSQSPVHLGHGSDGVHPFTPRHDNGGYIFEVEEDGAGDVDDDDDDD